MKNVLLGRLREPSTYAGLAIFVGSLSFLPNAANLSETITVVGTAVASLLAIWLPENKA